MRSRYTVLATILTCLAFAAGPAWAQGADPGDAPGAQAAKDQQVDLALGVLDEPPTLRIVLLQLPEEPGTRGPLPFDLEPPASQSDFSDPVVEVCRRGRLGNC